MARYFFNLEHVADKQGLELDSLADAKCAAARLAGKLICAAAEDFWDTGEFSMSVTDESGLVLFTLIMSAIEAPVISHHGNAMKGGPEGPPFEPA